jgi:hypothetical protein
MCDSEGPIGTQTSDPIKYLNCSSDSQNIHSKPIPVQLHTVKPVYSGNLGEFDKMTSIDR